ncbi:LCP family protein [Globicatella sulfidifaciens]
MKKIMTWLSVLSFFLVNITGVRAQEITTKQNYLFLGVDSGAGRPESMNGYLSDAIMIVTVDPATNTVTLTGMPRDGYAEIPGYGGNKVNSAFAYGGKELMIQTVESMIGVTFDRYVVANMSGFVDIVDALGGVTVIPPMSFDFFGNYFFEGDVEQKLDGVHALAYARERYQTGSDYSRQGRQREMIKNMINALLQVDDIESYRAVFDNRGAMIETDFTFDEIKALHAQFKGKEITLNEHQLQGVSEVDDVLGWLEIITPESLAELQSIVQ